MRGSLRHHGYAGGSAAAASPDGGGGAGGYGAYGTASPFNRERERERDGGGAAVGITTSSTAAGMRRDPMSRTCPAGHMSRPLLDIPTPSVAAGSALPYSPTHWRRIDRGLRAVDIRNAAQDMLLEDEPVTMYSPTSSSNSGYQSNGASSYGGSPTHRSHGVRRRATISTAHRASELPPLAVNALSPVTPGLRTDSGRFPTPRGFDAVEFHSESGPPSVSHAPVRKVVSAPTAPGGGMSSPRRQMRLCRPPAAPTRLNTHVLLEEDRLQNRGVPSPPGGGTSLSPNLSPVNLPFRRGFREGPLAATTFTYRTQVHDMDYSYDVPRAGLTDASKAQALGDAAKRGDSKAVLELLNEGVDVNVVDTVTQRTALHEAVACVHYAVAQLLLENGANPDIGHRKEGPPLLHAASWGNHKLVELLLQHGADVNAVDSSHYTALHLACEGSHEATVRLLLQAAANIRLKTPDGYTALQLASNERIKKLFRGVIGTPAGRLVTRGGELSPLSGSAAGSPRFPVSPLARFSNAAESDSPNLSPSSEGDSPLARSAISPNESRFGMHSQEGDMRSDEDGRVAIFTSRRLKRSTSRLGPAVDAPASPLPAESPSHAFAGESIFKVPDLVRSEVGAAEPMEYVRVSTIREPSHDGKSGTTAVDASFVHHKRTSSQPDVGSGWPDLTENSALERTASLPYDSIVHRIEALTVDEELHQEPGQRDGMAHSEAQTANMKDIVAAVQGESNGGVGEGWQGPFAEAAVADAAAGVAATDVVPPTPGTTNAKAQTLVAALPEANGLFDEVEPHTTGEIQWLKGELLGEGAYGKVFAGLNQATGELMAVKQLKLMDESRGPEHIKYMAALEHELSLYKTLRDEHIVGYLAWMKDLKENCLYIFLEYVAGGSIASMLERFGKFSEDLVRRYTRQVLQGLDYLHCQNIIHRDMKGGNVLISRNGTVKLADFGAAKAFNESTLTNGFKSIRGSVFWMAPEVIKGTGYGRRADIWSVGCTVVEMLTASHPWPEMDNSWSAIFHIAQAKSGPPIPDGVSPTCRDFLERCFQLDERLRPTAAELLEHQFVQVPDVVGTPLAQRSF
eukprot:jgi/Chlat1/752/Chrsp104S01223